MARDVVPMQALRRGTSKPASRAGDNGSTRDLTDADWMDEHRAMRASIDALNENVGVIATVLVSIPRVLKVWVPWIALIIGMFAPISGDVVEALSRAAIGQLVGG